MTNQHILVIERAENLQNIISLMLKQANYKVTVAHDYAEALIFILKTHHTINAVDLLITDMDAASEKACRYFLELFTQKKISIPFLVIFEEAGDGLIDYLTANGCKACITKPFDPASFMKIVNISLLEQGSEPAETAGNKLESMQFY